MLMWAAPSVIDEVACASRTDGCGRGIEADEVDADISVLLEGRRDRHPGGE